VRIIPGFENYPIELNSPVQPLQFALEEFYQLQMTPEAYGVTQTIELKTLAEAELELQVASLNQRVKEAEQRIAHLEDGGHPSIAVLTDLDPFEYEVAKPIYVSIEPDGVEYLATFTDACIAASGETQADAIENLKDMIVLLYEDLSEEPEGRLGPSPQHQLAVLKRFLTPRA
jgi:hypothetical protein